MNTYRLLRDNKETGPFSEEEMIAVGFKPYDLIWVEGRSAGWRYPSEITAFKNFAPAIEEQPYDRFYKKQPPQKLFALEEKNGNNGFVPTGIKENPPVIKDIEPAKQFQPTPSSVPVQPMPDYPARELPARHIHVTLPSGNRVNLTTIVTASENSVVKDNSPTNVVSANTETKHSAFEAPVYKTIAPVKEPAKKIASLPVQTIYNKVEEEYTKPLPVYQQAGSFSWGLIAAAFIGFATLVGLGIMIGLSINNGKNDTVLNSSGITKPKKTLQEENTVAKPSATLPDVPAAVNNEPVIPSRTQKELAQNAVVKNTVTPETSGSKEIKKALEETPAKDNKSLINQDEQILRAKPLPVVINVEKSLSLTANDFKTGAFGGITGLKCTLYNGSKYAIESVEVEVDYIQANNKVYKTEKLLFKDISAGAQATVDAPASSRGVKISSRIIKINAKDATLTNTTAKS